ncbi:MAG: hypothetical protein MJE12_26535, partial [Alphaproteobacteria bacterium]|nr:hypothetical protein [Alphaproteobacteria bacterium]
MTGFARQIGESSAGTLTVELRAVNHRYLDVQFRLPEELRCKEVELRQQVGDVLKRGKVECSVHFRRALGDTGEISVNADLVRQIGSGISEISALLPETRRPDPLDVLRWPGVVLEPEIDAEPLYREARTVLADTLDALRGMRKNEGKRIAEMLKSRCADILEIGKTVRARLPDVLAAVRQKQQERLKKLDV